MEILDSIVHLKLYGKEKRRKKEKKRYAASHDCNYDSLVLDLLRLCILKSYENYFEKT